MKIYKFILFIIIITCVSCFDATITFRNNDTAILKYSIKYNNDFYNLVSQYSELASINKIVSAVSDKNQLMNYLKDTKAAKLTEYNITKKNYGYDIDFAYEILIDNTSDNIQNVFFPITIKTVGMIRNIKTYLNLDVVGNTAVIFDIYNNYVPNLIPTEKFENDILAKLTNNPKDYEFITGAYKDSLIKNNLIYESQFVNAEQYSKELSIERKKINQILTSVKYYPKEKEILDNYTKNIPITIKFILPSQNLTINKDFAEISADKTEILYKLSLHDIISSNGKEVTLSYNK